MESRKPTAVFLAAVIIFSAVAASGSVIVAPAAANQSNLEITAVSLSDSEIVAGESATVTADLTSQARPLRYFEFEINLAVDGETVQTQTVLLQGGGSTTVSFDEQFDEAGSYDISVNGESGGTLSVLSPADLSVTGPDFDPDPVVENEPVDIVATVSNSGEVEGETETELLVDGSVVATETVSVPADSSTEVTFEERFDSPGEYDVRVSDSNTETLTVIQAAEFELSETALSSTEIREGESTTISGTVSNVGGSSGEYTAPLSVDSETVAEQTVELQAGQSEQLTFDRTFENSGEYSITIGETDVGTLTVLAPADLSVTDTTVASDTITTAESAQVDVRVENAGDITGEANVSFGIDGETVASQQVEVAGGESERIQFTDSFDQTGEFDLSINGEAAGSLTVLAPAEFVVTNTSVDPTTILEGNTTTTTAEVENVGDVEGTFTANLTVDGAAVDTESVTLDGGDSTTVSFERSFDSRGRYQIDVSGEPAGEVTVDAPAALSVTNVGASERTTLPDSSVLIFGTVENTGDRTGTYEAVLRIDGSSVETQTIEVPGRETDKVRFRYGFDSPGTYEVDIDDESGGEITVDQPATFGEVSASINTTRTVEDNPVGVELVVENSGDRTGSYSAVLTGNGTRLGVQERQIDGGETATLVFTERFPEAGSYTLAFNETTAGTVVIEEPPKLQVTNATIPADLVAPGERTTVEYVVENPGNWTATELINVTADGEVIAQESVTVDPGERKELVTEFAGTAGEFAVDGVEAGAVETIEDRDSSQSGSDDGGSDSASLPGALIVGLLVIVVGIASVYFVDQRR